MAKHSINLGVSVATFAAGLKKASQAANKAWLPKSGDWSAKMCERIDRDNYAHTERPTFLRRARDLPPLPAIRPEYLFEPVAICFLSSADQMLHQHLRFKQQTLSQLTRCGFAIDYEDEDGHVNFSRWIDASKMQICRIEFL